jgi:hypothetical protein
MRARLFAFATLAPLVLTLVSLALATMAAIGGSTDAMTSAATLTGTGAGTKNPNTTSTMHGTITRKYRFLRARMLSSRASPSVGVTMS